MGVSNWIILLTIWVYTAINTFIIAKGLISDIKNPYLGISSSYVFAYFIACFVNLLQFCFIYRSEFLTKHGVYIFYICNLIASYYCTIFFIKKFTFNSIKLESEITLTLGLFLYFSMTAIITLRSSFESDAPAITNSIVDSYYNLLCGMSAEYFKSKIIFISRVIPILTLFGMWFYSTTKPYNKNELNFFPKSANRPIILFMTYELIIILLPSLNVPNTIDKALAISILLGLRLWFHISLLHWLRHKDMEQIETSMLARSQKSVSKGGKKW